MRLVSLSTETADILGLFVFIFLYICFGGGSCVLYLYALFCPYINYTTDKVSNVIGSPWVPDDDEVAHLTDCVPSRNIGDRQGRPFSVGARIVC